MNLYRAIPTGLFAFLISFMLSASPIGAAVNLLPPDSMVVTPGGVDLRSGIYKWNKKVLAIGGSEKGGIDFRRITRSYERGELPGRLGQFNHNWDIRFKRRIQAGAQDAMTVTSDELSYTFLDSSSGSLSLTSNTAYATMSRVNSGGGSYYILTTADGTVVTSRLLDSSGLGLAQTVSKADGTLYSLSYDNLGPSGASRLRRVASNAGYALLLEYNTSGYVTKACVLNLSLSLAPSNNVCPTGALSATYTYSGALVASETDPTGATWTFGSNYSTNNVPFQETYYKPGASSPYLTLNYDYVENFRVSMVSQNLADGRTYQYAWTLISGGDNDDIALVPYFYIEDSGTISVTAEVYRYSVYSPPRVAPGLSSLSDSSGTTTFDWCLQTCAYAILKSKTNPEGIKAAYTYDNFHNLTQTVYSPKPGSSLATITESSNFDCVTTIINCSKASYTIDANGNRTDFAYSTTHGGVLLVTKPMVNGINPRTRYAYVQRYAWLSNGSGGFVQASSPIWLLATEKTCRTSATSGDACAGGSSDEVVTAYEYGADSGPNNLLLRGVAVTADGSTRRTCYGYDGVGNRISETKPRAGLTVCP